MGIGKNKVTGMCTKLTEKHINPNTFERMRVNLAAQVFSRSVSAAIRTAVEMGKMKRNTADIANSTANFIEKVDKVFDCLNSGSLSNRNIYKTGLKKDNIVYKYIESFLEYVTKVKVNSNTTVYWINGMKQTLKAVLMISDDIHEENSLFFYLLNALTKILLKIYLLKYAQKVVITSILPFMNSTC